ncbi:ras guanine nucleotide exchange factor domain-containing protein [Mycena olivaceomarginata]|nr:ras guanine nucleotide exchange factor domain-containing protein [Mycena olivaceomarginata]
MTSLPACRRLCLLPLPSAQLVPVVDQEGLLQSLAALVETLCRPWTENNPIGIGPEKTFQDVFLMTFRTFTTAESLLRMLIARYHTKCPRLASELEEEKLQLRAQRRILTLLSMLWQGTTLTLTEKESMTNTFTDFLQCIPPPLSKTAQLITSMVNVEAAQIQEGSVGQQSQRPADDEQDLSRRNSHHIAEQLTLRMYSIAIARPNLDAFCGSYDNTVIWIKTSILRGKRVGDRADIVNVWIQIAVVQISSRPHATLQRPVDRPRPLVPFITMYLTDIAHIADRYRDENGDICFVKRRQWYDVVNVMLRSQLQPYAISEDPSTITYIVDCMTRHTVDEDQLWAWYNDAQQSERKYSADLTQLGGDPL